LLGASNPTVATYARTDAVDVRIAAVDDGDRSARELADAAEALVLERLGDHVWARGTTTWAEAVDGALAALGWTLATAESGTDGSFATLLALTTARRRAEVLREAADLGEPAPAARSVAERAGADVGCAVTIRARGDDTAVSVAIVSPQGEHAERRLAFLGGEQGRLRAALVAGDVLLRELRRASDPTAR
jgi:hypothetical protein